MTIKVSRDLAKRLLIALVQDKRRLYGEFSGDFDGSERALWDDPLIREGLAAIEMRATTLRDEINATLAQQQFSGVELEAQYPPRFFIPLD